MNDLAMIVLNYNSGQDATICVKKLLKAYESLRIVIVDNCSTDGSYEVLREHFRDAGTVDVIQTPGNAGYSAGNNYGMKYAIGKYGVRYLGIANPDVIIDNPDLLPRMLRFLESHPDCGVIGGATQDPDGVFDIRKAAWNIPTPFRLVTDHLLFVRRKQLPVSTPIEDRFVRVDCIAGCFSAFWTKGYSCITKSIFWASSAGEPGLSKHCIWTDITFTTTYTEKIRTFL